MTLADTFNRSEFSRFLNRPAGRVFRVVAGSAFLVTGLLTRRSRLGLAALAWSVFPLSAGSFDVCFISAALGGPFSGRKIRARFSAPEPGLSELVEDQPDPGVHSRPVLDELGQTGV